MSLFQVSRYIIFTDKSLLTKLATEGEIVLMNSHLVRPKFSTTEGFITDIADIFPVFLLPVSVGHMVGQLSARGESLATEVAYEISPVQIRFMDFLHVSLKVADLLEKLPALLTTVLLHSRVDEEMSLQLVLQTELFATLNTLKPEPRRCWVKAVLPLSKMFVCLDLRSIGRPLAAHFTEIKLFL